MTAITDIAYVIFNHTDLDAAHRFYTDFGLQVVARRTDELVLRAASGHPYCYIARRAQRPGLVAIGLCAPNRQALEQAALFPEASAIEKLERQGGGECVRLTSPDGWVFELTHGVELPQRQTLRPALKLNNGDTKTRYGEWQRAEPGPTPVWRLGHVALLTPDFKRSAAWLQSRLGLRPSDLLYDGSPDDQVGGFFHAGAGDWVDHHTIALFPGDTARVHHTSFEVQDLDAQFLGNKWLREQRWQGLWGVGRHILGSQIFDYWFDPDANVVEHFTDGDLVTPGQPPGRHQVTGEALAQWGPPIDLAYFVNPWRQPD
ncbi:VOC family protein [Achromobacter marplatensis]|uniref:VOC family protein n=1 Tax=Achromobacter marplatensis TaxID=470868 RepID=UPI0039F649EC